MREFIIENGIVIDDMDGVIEGIRQISGQPISDAETIRSQPVFRGHRKIARIPQPLSICVGWGGIAPLRYGIFLLPPFCENGF